ncbi:MAG: tryptophan synthase subunit alpha [Candidatus Portiera sp.]|nr:tryptophan synthase subunit alpha [Portiera sp.]
MTATSRIERLFASHQGTFSYNSDSNADKSRLICFMTGGYPDLATSSEIINKLPSWGADLVEIGIPFSDASADGETIRKASKIALENGINTEKVLDMAKSFRQTNPDTPLLLMGYYNPIFHYGPQKFAKAAADSGVDGLILVDLPPEEEQELTDHLPDDLHLIHLITPTTDADRLKKIVANAKGFLYYVSVTGTTGSATPDLGKVAKHLKELNPPLPVAIGFGIRNAEQVKQFGELGQAVVVGSALLSELMDSTNNGESLTSIQDKISAQVTSYKKALQ